MNEQLNQGKPKGGLILKLVAAVAIVLVGYLGAQRLMTGEVDDRDEAPASKTVENAEPAQPGSKETEIPANAKANPQKQAQVHQLLGSLTAAAQQKEATDAAAGDAADAALANVPEDKQEVVGQLQEVIGDMNDNPVKRAQLLEFLKVLQEEDEQNGEQMSLEELLSRLEGADFNP